MKYLLCRKKAMFFVLSLVILLCATSCALKEPGINQHGSMSGGQRLPVSSGNAEGGRLYVEADQCHCNPPEYDFLDECRSMKMEETLFYQNLTRIQWHYQCSLRQGEKSPDFPSRMEKYCIRSIFVQDGYGPIFIDNSDKEKITFVKRYK